MRNSLYSSGGFAFGGKLLPNLTANSSRLSFIPRFRAASMNRWNCSGSRAFGGRFGFRTFFIGLPSGKCLQAIA
jgi:hypothetical protein